MSYVDTFDHEFLAYFGGIPLYHPLEKIEGSLDAFDFGCSPEHLVLGGGSGEHPAIVFSNLEIAVAHFISYWMLAVSPDDDGGMEVVAKLISDAGGEYSQWNSYLDPLNTSHYSDFLHFAGWTADDYYAFGKHCRSPALLSPFGPEDGALENWIAACLGELVFFSLPEVIDLSRLVGAKKIVKPIYENFLVPPPGYPTVGRSTKDGQVIWGNSRWKLR